MEEVHDVLLEEGGDCPGILALVHHLVFINQGTNFVLLIFGCCCTIIVCGDGAGQRQEERNVEGEDIEIEQKMKT